MNSRALLIKSSGKSSISGLTKSPFDLFDVAEVTNKIHGFSLFELLSKFSFLILLVISSSKFVILFIFLLDISSLIVIINSVLNWHLIALYINEVISPEDVSLFVNKRF